MGKWQTYAKFVKNFNDKALKVGAHGGVVFSAFAKHLQDNANPIYDQHAIRAIWASDRGSLSDRRLRPGIKGQLTLSPGRPRISAPDWVPPFVEPWRL